MEVDLQVHTNQPDVYFDGGYVKLQYDTSVFSPYIVANGNLDVSLCAEFQNGSYAIHNAYDTSANNVKVLAGLDFINSLQRVLLDTVPKPFLHLSFAVTLDTIPHKVVFKTLSTVGNPTYAQTANVYYMIYSDFSQIIHASSDTLTIPMNQVPVIYGLDSQYKIAGVGDTLTIRGKNFGNAKGEVFFKAADDGGLSYLRGLDDQYHISWTDTLIKVIVPALVYKGYENEAKKWSGGACSGPVKIQTANGDTTVNDGSSYLYINYSVMNHKVNNEIKRVYLVRQQCDYDFQFTLHSSLAGDTNKIHVIDTALRLWSRLTGLTLQLERDINGNLVFEDSVDMVGKNIISLTTNMQSGGLMSTHRRFNTVSIDSVLYCYRTTGSYILIRNEPQGDYIWSYSLTDVSPGQRNFYQTILHEIGHVLLMSHVKSLDELMYYGNHGLNYIIVPDTSSWAVKGVLANIEASRSINWPDSLGLYPIGVRQPQILVQGGHPPYVCNGQAITLQSNYPEEQLSWSTGATTPSIVVQQAGQYSLAITDHGCVLSDTITIGSSSLQVNFVTVNADCPNHANGSITANVTGDHSPYTYLWNGNGIVPAYTSQITNLSPGIYYLTVTDDVGCQVQLEESVFSEADTLRVCIPRYYDCFPDPPSLPSVSGCRKPIVAIVSGGEPPYQYGWYVGDVGMSSLPNHVVYISTSDYVCSNQIPARKFLYVLVQDACGQSKILEITPSMLDGVHGIDDPVTVKLFPNPATNHVEVTLDQEDEVIQTVQVYDVYGKLIHVEETNSNPMNLNVSGLASGVYFVRVTFESGEVVKTLVKR